MPPVRKRSQYRNTLPIPESLQTQVQYITRLNLSIFWMHRATIAAIARATIRIVLKLRINERAPRVHNAWCAFSPKISIGRMVQPKCVTIFMRRCCGTYIQILCLEISGIATKPIHERDVATRIIFNSEKIIPRISVSKNFLRLKVRLKRCRYFESNSSRFTFNTKIDHRLIPHQLNLIPYLLRYRRIRSTTIGNYVGEKQ